MEGQPLPRGTATHFVEINFEKDPQAQGIIQRVGPDKGGHWEIIEK